MLDAHYTKRENNEPKLLSFLKEKLTYEESLAIIDGYPFNSELVWFDKTEEGGGIYFKKGDIQDDVHAYLQFVPMEKDRGLLFLEIQLKRGFLGTLGKKSKSVAFEMVTTDIFKEKVKELFYYSVPTLYEKYKRELL